MKNLYNDTDTIPILSELTWDDVKNMAGYQIDLHLRAKVHDGKVPYGSSHPAPNDYVMPSASNNATLKYRYPPHPNYSEPPHINAFHSGFKTTHGLSTTFKSMDDYGDSMECLKAFANLNMYNKAAGFDDSNFKSYHKKALLYNLSEESSSDDEPLDMYIDLDSHEDSDDYFVEEKTLSFEPFTPEITGNWAKRTFASEKTHMIHTTEEFRSCVEYDLSQYSARSFAPHEAYDWGAAHIACEYLGVINAMTDRNENYVTRGIALIKGQTQTIDVNAYKMPLIRNPLVLPNYIRDMTKRAHEWILKNRTGIEDVLRTFDDMEMPDYMHDNFKEAVLQSLSRRRIQYIRSKPVFRAETDTLGSVEQRSEKDIIDGYTHTMKSSLRNTFKAGYGKLFSDLILVNHKSATSIRALLNEVEYDSNTHRHFKMFADIVTNKRAIKYVLSFLNLVSRTTAKETFYNTWGHIVGSSVNYQIGDLNKAIITWARKKKTNAAHFIMNAFRTSHIHFTAWEPLLTGEDAEGTAKRAMITLSRSINKMLDHWATYYTVKWRSLPKTIKKKHSTINLVVQYQFLAKMFSYLNYEKIVFANVNFITLKNYESHPVYLAAMKYAKKRNMGLPLDRVKSHIDIDPTVIGFTEFVDRELNPKTSFRTLWVRFVDMFKLFEDDIRNYLENRDYADIDITGMLSTSYLYNLNKDYEIMHKKILDSVPPDPIIKKPAPGIKSMSLGGPKLGFNAMKSFSSRPVLLKKSKDDEFLEALETWPSRERFDEVAKEKGFESARTWFDAEPKKCDYNPLKHGLLSLYDNPLPPGDQSSSEDADVLTNY
jgi:hypothetical protein